jgi:hypothetical protein
MIVYKDKVKDWLTWKTYQEQHITTYLVNRIFPFVICFEVFLQEQWEAYYS